MKYLWCSTYREELRVGFIFMCHGHVSQCSNPSKLFLQEEIINSKNTTNLCCCTVYSQRYCDANKTTVQLQCIACFIGSIQTMALY